MLTRDEKVRELARCGLAYVVGSLLDAPRTSYTGHQCNCVTRGSAGLATIIFKAYPDANTYKRRMMPSAPGTATLHGGVVNLYAQYDAGACLDKKGDANAPYETYEQRLAWLASALDDARSQIKLPATLALPAGLGCDLAGGSWARYADALKAWGDAHPDVALVFYVQ